MVPNRSLRDFLPVASRKKILQIPLLLNQRNMFVSIDEKFDGEDDDDDDDNNDIYNDDIVNNNDDNDDQAQKSHVAV